MNSSSGSRSSRVRAYLELLRVPNLFTAAADVMMGFLFVQVSTGKPEEWELRGTDAYLLGVLVVSSVLLYAAGVVLNDVYDVEADRRTRSRRPIPSGRVSLRAARWLGWELLFFGAALPWIIALPLGQYRAALVSSALAACIVFYDTILKRTPLGPAAMGACRMLNVLLGMSVLAGPFRPEHWLVAGGIGVYVAGLTWLARHEDETSPRWSLAAATGVMLSGVAMLGLLPEVVTDTPLITQLADSSRQWHLGMAMIGAIIGWRCVWAVIEPVPYRVQVVVTHGIMSLVILDAFVCYAARGVTWAVVILVLLIPALTLGRWIRAT
jgi:4-hydroxybenzoate polyprenyltransferase